MVRAQNTNQVPPPFRSAHDPLRDVVTRRTERTILKGNLKALVHNLSHLGQAFEPNAWETDILAQNYV